MKYKLTILLCVAMVLLAGFAYTHQEPQVITEYIEVIDEVRVPYYIIVSEPEYIECPVYVEVERIVSIPTELRNFENLSELREWRENLVLSFSGSMSNDCGNIALAVQRKAYEDGYYISLWPRYDIWHMANVAICGKSVYGFDETGRLSDDEIFLGKIR